jgi:NAD(P)-dependent dehydrogenase (short-subunit alcohol dehydrogenase family)
MRLAGKKAFVTGGAQGIGRAVVAKLSAEGARTAFCDLDEETARKTVAELQTGGGEPILFVPGDVTREDDVARVVGQVSETFDGIDVLVNNAGINAYFDAAAMTEAEWETVFGVDLKGAWLCCKHVLPLMRAAGSGSIVNISSIHARLTMKGMFPYAAAKSGLIGLTRSLALDVGEAGIRVNAVCPGWTRTRLVEESFEHEPDPGAAERSVLDVHPLGRIGSPEEIANVVAFVASDEASFMTGSAVFVDGGLGAKFAT